MRTVHDTTARCLWLILSYHACTACGQTQRITLTLKHSVTTPGCITSLAFADNGRMLVAATANAGLHMWDVSTGQHVKTIRPATDKHMPGGAWENSELGIGAFGDNGNRIALKHIATGYRCSRKKYIELWDRQGKKCWEKAQDKPGTWSALAMSPDGKSVAIGHKTGRVDLTACDTGIPTTTLGPFSGEIVSLAFSPDSHSLLVRDGRSLALVDLLKSTVSLSWPCPAPMMYEGSFGSATSDISWGSSRLRLNPQSTVVASIVGAQLKLMTFPLRSRKAARVLPVRPCSYALAFLSDGWSIACESCIDARGKRLPTSRLIVVGCETGYIRGSAELPAPGAVDIASSPDGQTLAVAVRNLSVKTVSGQFPLKAGDSASGSISCDCGLYMFDCQPMPKR